MHIFIDQASVKLFADDGSLVMTDIFFSNEKLNTFQLYPLGDSPLLSGQFYQLKSIW
jgi:fructan beta-fructosidase